MSVCAEYTFGIPCSPLFGNNACTVRLPRRACFLHLCCPQKYLFVGKGFFFILRQFQCGVVLPVCAQRFCAGLHNAVPLFQRLCLIGTIHIPVKSGSVGGKLAERFFSGNPARRISRTQQQCGNTESKEVTGYCTHGLSSVPKNV